VARREGTATKSGEEAVDEMAIMAISGRSHHASFDDTMRLRWADCSLGSAIGGLRVRGGGGKGGGSGSEDGRPQDDAILQQGRAEASYEGI
jgi:hypothetical protein